MDTFPCSDNNSCEGTNGMRLASSMNNISFVQPSVDVLLAYYRKIRHVMSPISQASHLSFSTLQQPRHQISNNTRQGD